MRLIYDPQVDAAYLYLVPSIGKGEVVRTVSSMLDLDRSFVAFDVDSKGKILGIEILGASRVLPAVAIEEAVRPGCSAGVVEGGADAGVGEESVEDV